MQNLITKYTVPYPPVAMGPLNDPAGAHLFDSATRVHDSRGNPLPSFYTHGYNLASVPGLDEDLMHLLLRCLADMPVDRPTLWELNWVMVNKERSPGWAIPGNDPDGIRAWCDRMFNDPPAVSAACQIVFLFNYVCSVLSRCVVSLADRLSFHRQHYSPPRLRQRRPRPSRPRCRRRSPRCQGMTESLVIRVMVVMTTTTTMMAEL